MSSYLNSIKKHTIIVADSGDFTNIKSLRPKEATTNPSLILKAAQKEEYHHILQNILKNNKNENISTISDLVTVAFGKEILKIVPGRVSTEVDARLSFNTIATIEKARFLIKLYESSGISRERILIKIASTWEGIQAAKILELEGIRCNLTLLFSMAQAIACAQANVTLISPFVGRIYDWHKKNDANWKESEKSNKNDPGVQSVTKIFNYYKSFGIKTEIMGASFRNIGQIISLSGCDLLTISPDLLKLLNEKEGEAPVNLVINNNYIEEHDYAKNLSEHEFRYMLNDDAMASEKLSEGIRLFILDSIKLDKIITKMI
ncbi:transaldolase [Candidatus Kinetoplastibacterium oncopeltii TCC290E]|uniref:Transaldolase n=1 Tax=Candidatus Kinetoplastidibacterium stringomonadis TCC290E TaxID=1208920 RepID=M1LYD0_9PROT|nr:transaldolase [Candidatus Kinetoplastibacterium oncopeltii]AGF48164.1 transaldolase [Candidatus Kinetoplastibacterium oncopeltii TCC290E]